MRVVFDFKPAFMMLDDVKQRQLPYAHTLALTNTAMYGRRAAIDEFRRQFDRPKPSTLNERSGPLRVKSASLSKYPNDYSEVRVKDQPQPKGDPALVYLSHHIRGGARVEKRSEQILRSARIMDKSEFAIPAIGAKLNAYGNMSVSQLRDIISAVGGQRDTVKNTSGKTFAQTYKNIRARQRRGEAYFVARGRNSRTAHLADGVYQRYGHGHRIRPVLIFVKGAPRYRKRIRWEQIAMDVGRMRFPIEFHIAMKKAIATQKVVPNTLVAGFTQQIAKSYQPTVRLLGKVGL